MPKLLNFREIRALLGGRGRTTCYRDMELGRLPQPIKIGGRLYWREDEVEVFLERLADAR